MEGYIQMLIPADAEFVPEATRIASYFDMLVDVWGYEFDRNNEHLHFLRVYKLPSKDEVAEAIKASNGRMFPPVKKINLQEASAISGVIANLPRCVIAASGHWQPSQSPIKVPREAWPDFSPNLYGGVSCDLRPEPVSTSNSWEENGIASMPDFGDPAVPGQTTGVFTHPVSRRNVVLPLAGCARFWVGFDFGEWIAGLVPEDFDLLEPALIEATEKHFGVRMVQAGRALP